MHVSSTTQFMLFSSQYRTNTLITKLTEELKDSHLKRMGLLTLGTSPSQCLLLLKSFLAINVTFPEHNTDILKSRGLPSCHSGWLNESLSANLCQSLYVSHCVYQAAAPPEWTVSASVKAMHSSQPVCQNQPRELFRM